MMKLPPCEFAHGSFSHPERTMPYRNWVGYTRSPRTSQKAEILNQKRMYHGRSKPKKAITLRNDLKLCNE